MRLPILSRCLLGPGITGLSCLIFPLVCQLSFQLLCQLPCPAKSEERLFTAPDGVVLSGTYTGDRVPRKGVVLLLPMLGRTRDDYAPLVKALSGRGFSVLALDNRGHGRSKATSDSKESSLDYNKFSRSDWEKIPGDILSVLKELNSGGAAYIVGASIGANAAAIASSLSPRVKALVLLSPGLDYHSLEPASALAKTKIPVMIVVSRQDEYSYESSKQLAASNTSNLSLESFNNAGHGTDMFKTQKGLPVQIAEWLEAQTERKQ